MGVPRYADDYHNDEDSNEADTYVDIEVKEATLVIKQAE